MFCVLLGQDIKGALTGPLVLWFYDAKRKINRHAHRSSTTKFLTSIVEKANLPSIAHQKITNLATGTDTLQIWSLKLGL